MSRLDITREDHQHPYDITLVVKDGKEFQAHRDVLSQASLFFEKLLNSNMKENNEGIIRLKMIMASQMADVLQFIYTGDVQISTQEDAEKLIEIADYLLISNLKAFAGKCLEEHMTIFNCISIYNFAEKFLCEDLVASARRFVCSNFSTVAASNDFLNFQSREVELFISSNEIVIDAEENVFEIILRWIEHTKSERSAKFSELFRHMRLTCVSRDFLVSDVVTNDLVKENVDCLESVTIALQWIDRPADCNVPRPHPPRKALERDVIVVTACGEKLYTHFYFPATDEWYRLPPSDCEPTHVFSLRGNVYVVTKPIARSVCYEPDLNRWSPAPWTKLHSNSELMKLDQTSSSLQIRDVIVVQNEICFIVACRSFLALWTYNTDLNTVTPVFHWTDKASFCAVVVDKHIYFIGGEMFRCLNDDVIKYIKPALSESARFDTAENTWQEIAPLKEARRSAFGVSKTDENKIFIAGGIGIFRDWLKSCEVYNILTDEWQFIASLTVPRAFGQMVLIDETIYVLGGNFKARFKVSCPFPGGKVPVEWFDQGKDKWNDISVMPISKITLKRIPKNVDYFYFGFYLQVCSHKLFKGVELNNSYPIRVLDPSH